jgi:hypothetical protein
MNIQFKKVLAGLFLALPLFASIVHAEEKREAVMHTEPGRFGVGVSMTDNGLQTTLLRIEENWEAQFSFDSGWTHLGPGVAGDIGVTLRLGKRWNIGDYNYLAAGLQYHTNFFGMDGSGNSIAGAQRGGPYLGFQRNFQGTSLLLQAWVIPIWYNRENDGGVDANGKTIFTDNVSFFQAGGITFGYLF